MNSELFYDFLNELKRDDNISLIEAIEEGVSALFESATVSQSLKGRAKKHPFFALQAKYIKKSLMDKMQSHEYNFPESGDTRNPYEHILDKQKFMEIFLNWATWEIIDNMDSTGDLDDESSMEDINEMVSKEKYYDPKQQELFKLSDEEKKRRYFTEIERASFSFFKNHEKEYDAHVMKLLYDGPQEDIYNPEENASHDGSMSGWGDDEYEAYNDLKYSGDHPWDDEAVQIWVNYLYDASSNANLLKNFVMPNYHDSTAYSDANSINEDNYQKVIEQVNKEIGRETYEEAESIVEMDGGFSWVDSTKKSCSAEGKEMGHCGNEYGPDLEEHDELWSLRQGDSPSEWQSHLTLIINGKDIIPGKRIIKQFVGDGPKSGNAHPSEKYHPHIMKLLTSKDERNGKYIVDGFHLEPYHASSISFRLSDLSEEHQKLLKNVRPELFTDVGKEVSR